MKQLLWGVTLILCSSALANAQTIADLARQERAKRRGAVTIVVTNESIKSDSTTTPQAAPAAKEPAAPANPPAAASGHDEKWWRGQFEKAREDVQRLQTQVPLLEANVNAANREFLTRSYDPDGRGQKAIKEATDTLEKTKSDLTKAQEKLSQLEDGLRREGAPAGWAR